MTKYFTIIKAYCFLTLLAIATACKVPVKKDLPKEKAYPKLIKTIGSPKYGNVQSSLQDKDGNLWFGTTENGLYKYDGKSFTQFLVADGLNSNNVSSLLEDKDGKIWIGTEAGLCIYYPTSSVKEAGKKFVEIKIPIPKNLPPNKNPHYLNSHCVYSIMQAKNGELWLATIDGVYIYNGKSLPTDQTGFTLFEINGAANGFLTSNDKAERILEDKAGNIWFGGRTNGGVYRYDGKSITNLKLAELFQEGPTPKPHQWGWPQLQDRNGNIWFSNWGGVYRYDGKTFTSFTKKDGISGIVTKIIEDKKGNLWFGGDGIYRYDGKTFIRFTTKDGQALPGVWSILEDRNGNLWVGTRETSLYFLDAHQQDGQTKSFIIYSEYKQQPATN